MVNFSFNFQVLPSRELCFSKCFCSIFTRSFSQLLSNFDLFNSSILISNARRSALFLASNSSSEIFCFSSSNDRSNKSNFLFVRFSACCAIIFACSVAFLPSLIERYDVSEVSEDALKRRRLRKFGLSQPYFDFDFVE